MPEPTATPTIEGAPKISNCEATSACGPLGLIPAVLSTTDIDFGTREREDYDDHGELLASIRQRGILQSLLVLERPGQPYLLLAGGRRFRCAQELKLTEIPVLISTKPLDLVEIKTIELVENLHRKDLSVQEELKMKALLHRLMLDQHGAAIVGSRNDDGWTMKKTAELLNIDPGTLSGDLKIAAGLEVLPELHNCKNKFEARRVLKAVLREHNAAVRAEEIDEKLKDGPKFHLAKTFIHGDFFDKAPALPSASFDFIELDPDYGMSLLDMHESRRGPLQYTKENYHEWEPKLYLENLNRVLREAYRLLTTGGWLICWFAMEPHFEPTFQAIIDAGFTANRVPGFWIKPSSHCLAPTFLLGSAVDTFFYARKGPATLASPGHSNVYHSNLVHPSRKTHPTEKPIELYEQILSTFIASGARMLSPMCGSGNQLLAAANLRIQAIGFDLGKAYQEAFKVKVFDGDYGNYKSLSTSLQFQEVEEEGETSCTTV